MLSVKSCTEPIVSGTYRQDSDSVESTTLQKQAAKLLTPNLQSLTS